MVPPCASPLPITWRGTVPSFPNRIITAWDKGGKKWRSFPQMITRSHMVLQFSDYGATETHIHTQTGICKESYTKQQTQTVCELHQGHSFDSELWDKLTARASHHSLTEQRERHGAKRKRETEILDWADKQRKRPVKRQSQREWDKKKERQGENEKGEGFIELAGSL